MEHSRTPLSLGEESRRYRQHQHTTTGLCSSMLISFYDEVTYCKHSAHAVLTLCSQGVITKLGAKKEEVLRQLRLVRKAKKMSYQSIVEATEAIGFAVSLSSVRRVFDERFHADDFKYDTTLKPIVRVVMGIEQEFHEEPQSLPEATANVEGLVAVVDYKDSTIERLQAEIAKIQKWNKALRISVICTAAVLVLLMMVLEAYIVLDLEHPEWGLLFD